MEETVSPREDGFEYEGNFYRWHVSDMGKDLMLIDRIAGMAVTDFFDAVADEHDSGRGPVVLTLIATSLRHANPDWSVERIVRLVMNLQLSAVEFVRSDEADKDEAMLPLPGGPETPPSTGADSSSPPNGSSPSSTPPASSTFKTLSETPL